MLSADFVNEGVSAKVFCVLELGGEAYSSAAGLLDECCLAELLELGVAGAEHGLGHAHHTIATCGWSDGPSGCVLQE